MNQTHIKSVASMILVCTLLIPFTAKCQEASEKQGDGKPNKVEDIGEGSLRNMGILGADWADRNLPAKANTQNGVRKNDKSITDQNGKRTVSFQKVGGKLVVSITRRYDSADIQQLRTRHPELSEYVEMFPQEIDDGRVELMLAITSKYEARNEEELKKKSNEAFNVYRRYFNNMNRPRK